MKTLLVTGTDTGVGKTWVTCLLIRQLQQHGLRVGAYKPACSGSIVAADGREVWTDVELLKTAIGSPVPESWICPQKYSAAVAPNAAAVLEGKIVSDTVLFDGARQWQGHVDFLLIEGAGGLLSPLSNQSTALDLAQAFGARVIIVAANRLGVINHTRLTVQCLRSCGIRISAIVLNDIAPAIQSADESSHSNAAQLKHWIPDIPLFTTAWDGSNFQSFDPGQPATDSRTQNLGLCRLISDWDTSGNPTGTENHFPTI